MEIIFLGSGSALPTRERMLPSIVINREGENILFDCGESTQFQMISAGVKPFKIKSVFLSHLHGDHIFGLPGLLSTMNLLKRTEPINIFGPVGIKAFLESALKVSMMTSRYEINIYEIDSDFKGGIVFENEEYYITALPLDHSLFDLGYRFQEKDKPGHLNVEKAQRYNLPMGPLIGEFKKGNDVVFNGNVIKPKDVLDEPIRGKSIAIVTDTKPCENGISLAKEADVLIHEATFEKELFESAQEMKHSTTIDAAQIAEKANTKLLIITHISSRNNDVNKLLDECTNIFKNTIIAYDFLRVKI